jgi:apolipoprotein N-acyltransferase
VNESPRVAFVFGFVQGAAFSGLTMPWIYTVLKQYGPLPPIEAGTLFGLLIAAISLFHAAFASAVAWISQFGVKRACIAAPLLWVIMEFAMNRLPAIGFPWNFLGYVAADNLALVQITTITGIFGLCLLVASCNGLLAWAALGVITGRTRKGVKTWSTVMGVLILIGLIGPRLVPQAPSDHVAHLVQTNFPVSNGYPSDWMQTHAGEMEQLETISTDAARKVPGLVVWPEVPAPFSLQDGNFQTRALRIARGAGSGFLVGVVDWKPLGDGHFGANNSAALLGPDGQENFIYDKIHLVPFSEYIPWRKWIFFAKDLTGLVGDFQHGTQYKVGNESGGRFSVYICYEAIFPDEVRRFTLAGAQLLVNISDDGWFGGSGAPAQHLAMARVRAVENRRWLLRDTNNGITVSVDPYGRIAARLPAEIRGELDAPYAFRSDLTLYARWGDWIAWLCVLAAVMLFLKTVRDARARNQA